MLFNRIIPRYLIGSVLPYFIFSWLLLSVILFVQQASRFSDIFFSVNIPSQLVWQLTLALVPNVVAFTCPMAALVGVIIGLTKMQSDNELTAIRAAGVGNLRITAPVAALGVVLSLFAFLVNLYGVPLAARIVRQVALRTAIYKLESPIEPGVFNTEVAGLTIYVRNGDLSDGSWKNIFIYSEDAGAGVARLITSGKGRVDYSDQMSELVLDDAVVSTVSIDGSSSKFISEHVGQIRYAVKTRRDELVNKLSSVELSPEELGLSQLSDYAGRKEGPEKTEAEILWQRRIILSFTPLIFCLLGTSMVLRYNRRGRGFGIFVALVSLIIYYLLAFLGEQLARTGKVSVLGAGLFPLTASIAAVLWFSLSTRVAFAGRIAERLTGWFSRVKLGPRSGQGRRNLFVDLTTGLRDLDIVLDISKYYLLTLGFLGAVFLIFTAFELWKFAGTMEGGIVLLLRYLFYLLPFVYIQLSPSAAMIATLATYVIKSRQNEIVTWTSAGQSVYRLLVPALIFMAILGAVNWGIQETVLPDSNRVQDDLRNSIRSRGVAPTKPVKYWAIEGKRIYSFNNASDNEKSMFRISSTAGSDFIGTNVTVYEFGEDGLLQKLYRISSARWENGQVEILGSFNEADVSNGRLIEKTGVTGEKFSEVSNPFSAVVKKPSQMTSGELRSRIASADADAERRSFSVALQKRYATAFLPIIIALFTAPFALSLSRKGKVVTVGYAIALWLVFMGVSSTMEQFGTSGQLSPEVAVWGPLGFFAALGVILMSRVKT